MLELAGSRKALDGQDDCAFLFIFLISRICIQIWIQITSSLQPKTFLADFQFGNNTTVNSKLSSKLKPNGFSSHIVKLSSLFMWLIVFQFEQFSHSDFVSLAIFRLSAVSNQPPISLHSASIQDYLRLIRCAVNNCQS